jgi:hypothetical protein
MNSFVEFYWQVPEAGFEWFATKGFPSRQMEAGVDGVYLVDRMKFGVPNTVRNYPAFQETGLFRRFAVTEPTKDAIVEFANAYGFLGGEVTIPVQIPVENEANTYNLGKGETLEGWGAEILAMRHMIEVWEAARAEDAETLAEFIRWKGKAAKGEEPWPHTEVFYRGPRSRFEKHAVTFRIASERTNPETLARFRPGDVVQPTWYALQRFVNKKLTQHGAVPKLLWHIDRRKSELEMHFVPQSLIGALWLQFAHGITGNKEYRQCEQCGRWFEVAAEVRQDGKFCQGACRSRAYRARQSESRKLHAAGTTFAEIAKRLNSDTRTVRGWVKG